MAYNNELQGNQTEAKEDRRPLRGGVRDAADKLRLDRTVRLFPKTVNMKAARFPNKPSEYFHRYKASEVMLFTQISALTCGELPPTLRQHWLLLRSIALRLSSTSLPVTSIDELYGDMKRWAVAYEELHGPRAGIPKLHYAFHLISSIRLWGVPCSNWCSLQEGLLGVFKKQAELKNGKNVHYSLASVRSVQQFLRVEDEKAQYLEFCRVLARSGTSGLVALLLEKGIGTFLWSCGFVDKLFVTHMRTMKDEPYVYM